MVRITFFVNYNLNLSNIVRCETVRIWVIGRREAANDVTAPSRTDWSRLNLSSRLAVLNVANVASSVVRKQVALRVDGTAQSARFEISNVYGTQSDHFRKY